VAAPPAAAPRDAVAASEPRTPTTAPPEASDTAPEPRAPAAPPTPAAPDVAPRGGLSLVDVRRLWPDVVDACRSLRKATWSLIGHNAQVVGFEGELLTLGFTSAGLRDQFVNGGHEPVLRQATVNVFGIQPRIEAIIDPGADAGSPPPAAPATGSPARPEPSAAPRDVVPVPASEPPVAEAPPRRSRVADLAAEAPELVSDPDADVDPDDADVDPESGADLLARELGAQVIEEIPHQ